MNAELKVAMQAKFEQAGLGFESIKVFGAIRCNVHVICVSRDTAAKWAMLLSQVFPGAKVETSSTIWDAKENKNTSLKPTKRKGYFISVAA